IAIERVAAAAAGLIAVVPVEGRRPRGEQGDVVLSVLKDAFDDRVFVGTWRHRDGRDRARTAAAIAAEERFSVPAIASARPIYHPADRKPLAAILRCIRLRTTLDRAGTDIPPNAEAFLRSGERMLALFPDRPAWVRRTVEIADRCTFSLGEIRYHFPSETLCLPGETPDEALRRLVEEGCERRYPEGTPPAVREQIEKELVLIKKLKVAPYFLSVQQIVALARRLRILCQGRGSAANSAVC